MFLNLCQQQRTEEMTIFSVEFYLRFWNKLSGILTEVLKYIYVFKVNYRHLKDKASLLW